MVIGLLLPGDGEVDADVPDPPGGTGGCGAADVVAEQGSNAGSDVGEDGLRVAGGRDDPDLEQWCCPGLVAGRRGLRGVLGDVAVGAHYGFLLCWYEVPGRWPGNVLAGNGFLCGVVKVRVRGGLTPTCQAATGSSVGVVPMLGCWSSSRAVSAYSRASAAAV